MSLDVVNVNIETSLSCQNDIEGVFFNVKIK